tara:strand:+ start:8918 stop:10228 length:1311 start_codon:yes stop_codon:yes gene_type:complete
MLRERSNKLEYPSGLHSLLSNVNKKLIIGRVTDIILNDQHPKFEKYGGWSSIGTIFFEEDDFPGSNKQLPAKPFIPQYSAYPLVNELVLLFLLPTKNIGRNTSSKSFYYINMIGIWNSPHHNAYPNPITPQNPPSQNKDYFQTDAGSPIRKTDYNSEIKDGNSIRLNSDKNISQDTFIERNNIHPLLPFAGDIIYEGRWGNSIRFGSTAKSLKSNFRVTDQNPYLNNWSKVGKNGDPIIILRNGQNPQSSDEGWTSITEDINYDKSSIYLTSNQQIPISAASVKYNSYTEPWGEIPSSPSSYTGNQVIISSGRLLFNSKKDHILLSSQRTISFGALKGFNFDTKANFVVDVGTHIKLGSKEASQPLILGDKFLFDLNKVMDQLSFLCKMLQSDTIWPAGVSAPKANVIGAAVACESLITTFQNRIESYKSKTTFAE